MSWDEVRWDPHGQVATVSIVELKRPAMKREVLMTPSLRMRVCFQP